MIVIKVIILNYTVTLTSSYILPKCAKTREPEDEHCVLRCTYTSTYATPYP